MLWQYRFWSFRGGLQSYKVFWLKINCSEMKSLNFRDMGRCQKVWKFDFQSQYFMSKKIRIFLKEFHWRISFQEHIFCYWHFLTTSILKPLYVQFLTIFTQLTPRFKNFLIDWLLVLGLKEGLVECATLCVKSWVILMTGRP